ncbi:hypothetical protein GCM10020331_075400 [Ectobacillus funiculus]
MAANETAYSRKKSDDRLTNFKQQGDFVSFNVDSDQSQEAPITIYYKKMLARKQNEA